MIMSKTRWGEPVYEGEKGRNKGGGGERKGFGWGG